MIHEIIEIFHQYLLKHVQVSNQDMWFLSNIEAGLESLNLILCDLTLQIVNIPDN